MSRITMAAAFGTGYVLGARAGRQRYDELRDRAQELWTNPKVQKQAQKVQEQAKQVPGQVKEHLPGSMGDTSQDGSDAAQGNTMGNDFGPDFGSASDAAQGDSWSSDAPGSGVGGSDFTGGQARG